MKEGEFDNKKQRVGLAYLFSRVVRSGLEPDEKSSGLGSKVRLKLDSNLFKGGKHGRCFGEVHVMIDIDTKDVAPGPGGV